MLWLSLILTAVSPFLAFAEVPSQLTNLNTVTSVEIGRQRLMDLATWAEAESRRIGSDVQQITRLQIDYANAHNLVFLRTHQVRLGHDIENQAVDPYWPGASWSASANATLYEVKEQAYGYFETLEQGYAQAVRSRDWTPGRLISDRMWLDGRRPSFLSATGAPVLNRKASSGGGAMNMRAGGSSVLPLLRFETPSYSTLDVGSLVHTLRSASRAAQPTSEVRDLSRSFPVLQQQYAANGEVTGACVGFAISSAMQFLIDRFPQIPYTSRFRMSPWQTYVGLQSEFLGSPDCALVLTEASVVASTRDRFEGLMTNDSLARLQQPTRCLLTDPYVNRSVQIREYEAVQPANRAAYTAEQLKEILRDGLPILVEISTDGRIEQEEWYTPVRGEWGHALLIVGYGNSALNPFTLTSEDYFIVRDSLVRQPYHFRVSVRDFLRYLDAAYVIRRVAIP